MKLIYIALGFGILTAAPLPQSGDRLEQMKEQLVENFLHEAGMETSEHEDDEGNVIEERRVTKVFVEEEEGPVESSIDRLIEDIEELQGEEVKNEEVEEEITVEVIDEQVMGDEVVISEDDLIVKNEIELIDAAPEVDALTGENFEELDEYYDPNYLRGHGQRKGGRRRGHRGHGRRRSRH